jgi:hypothetical protein
MLVAVVVLVNERVENERVESKGARAALSGCWGKWWETGSSVHLRRDCTPVAARSRTEQLCGAHRRGRREEGGGRSDPP